MLQPWVDPIRVRVRLKRFSLVPGPSVNGTKVYLPMSLVPFPWRKIKSLRENSTPMFVTATQTQSIGCGVAPTPVSFNRCNLWSWPDDRASSGQLSVLEQDWLSAGVENNRGESREVAPGDSAKRLGSKHV